MVGAGMVEIPAGRFRMGSVGFYPEEGPVREVEVVSRSTAGRLRSRGLPGLLRIFSGVRGRKIFRSPHLAFCMDRLVGPTEDPLPRSYAWKSTLNVLALHGYPPW